MPNSGKKPPVTRGRCQCRAVEYEFEGAPKWVMHCHTIEHEDAFMMLRFDVV